MIDDGGGCGWLAANDLMTTVILPCTMPDAVAHGIALGVLDRMKQRHYGNLYPEEQFVRQFVARLRLEIPAPLAPVVSE